MMINVNNYKVFKTYVSLLLV